MTSLKQFETITKLGTKCDGRKILIRAPKHGLASLGESRAYYRIELPCEHDAGVHLIPLAGNGSIASSLIRTDTYAYENGGSLYRAAVEAAKEIASALGFPC